MKSRKRKTKIVSILNVITFRHVSQILFENKQDISQTCFNEEEKQSVKMSTEVLRKPSTSIAFNEEVTNLESLILSSTSGIKDARLSESELVTNKISIQENVFCYDSKPQASYSPKINAEGNAKRKLKQV